MSSLLGKNGGKIRMLFTSFWLCKACNSFEDHFIDHKTHLYYSKYSVSSFLCYFAVGDLFTFPNKGENSILDNFSEKIFLILKSVFCKLIEASVDGNLLNRYAYK